MDATQEGVVVSLADIDWDASLSACQMRGQTQSEVVEEYAELYRQGVEMPPVVCFSNGKTTWLVDGFHRAEAATDAGLLELPAEIRKGSLRDAILFSVGANTAHGLRRTNADKRRAVLALLTDKSWMKWSDRKIASQCAVSNRFVGNLREEISVNGSQIDSPAAAERTVERNGKTYEMQTGNIGKREPVESPTVDIEPDEPEEAGDEFIVEEAAGEPAEPEPRKPHVSNNSGENEWYTPPAIVNCASRVMDTIELDPASSEKAQEVIQADRYFTAKKNGLKQSWKCDSLWLNPPYAQPLMSEFVTKFCESWLAGDIGQACVLVNNATETQWFQRLAAISTAVCFLRGRVKFHDSTGKPANTPLQGQAVLYFGNHTRRFASEFEAMGLVMEAHDYE
jgi:hypothetical protein